MPRKLVLYSDQIDSVTDAIDERLREWLPVGSRIGYIPSSPDRERVWFEGRAAFYARYGYSLRFFGLEDEFDASQLSDLFACDAIHLTGGNTFRFLYWLRVRGLIALLQRYVADGGVLIGVSAGAILMTSDIRTSSLCGDTMYPGLADFTGLSLVVFAVFPHYDGSPEAVSGLIEFSRGSDGVVYAVPDVSGIVVDGERVDLIGPVWSARGGEFVRS
jgi:dipeptidase E